MQITPDTALSYTLDASDRVYASYITGALGVYVVSESDAYITIGTLGVSDDSTFIIELVQISPVGIVDTESYYIEENSNGNLYSATVDGDSSTIYIPSNSPKYTYTDGVYTEIADWSNYPLELVFVKYSYKLSEQAEGYVSLATLNDCTPYVSYVPDGEQVPDDGVSDTPYYVFTYDDGSGDTVTDYYYIENLESQPRYSEYVLSESGDKYISSSINGFVATINTAVKYNALVRVTILSLKNPGNAIFVQKQNITIEFDDEFNAEKINNATVLENYLNDTLGAFNLASSSFFTVKANIDGTIKDLTGGIEGMTASDGSVSSITNFTVANPYVISAGTNAGEYFGLFSSVASTAYIMNLRISGNIDISSTTRNAYIGLVAGVNNGVIKNFRA